MDYTLLLLHSYQRECGENPNCTRGGYLSSYIFDFTTYDDDMDELLARKAIEVCAAITNRTTFEYIEASKENYQWFIILCNMPFFADRIEWGTSIRGAWWKQEITLSSCGIWQGDEQLDAMTCHADEWKLFTEALIDFSGSGIIALTRKDVS